MEFVKYILDILYRKIRLKNALRIGLRKLKNNSAWIGALKEKKVLAVEIRVDPIRGLSLPALPNNSVASFAVEIRVDPIRGLSPIVIVQSNFSVTCRNKS